MKDFADDNFKFYENGRKLSKWVENTVGKGEIARYEQFLLFPQCFQKALQTTVFSKGFADDNFKFYENGIKLSKWVENTVGKEEIARYEQFLLFPQCFQKALQTTVFSKGFADDNFKFYENGRKLSKWVENTVRKGEIARYEQFLLFPQCFQKACFPGASKGVIVWEWVKTSLYGGKHSVAWYITTKH